MSARWSTWIAASGWLALAALAQSGLPRSVIAANLSTPTVLIIAGPCQHPPGTHEAAAGARLIKHLVENAEGVQPLRAEVLGEWPKDTRGLQDARSVVFIGDIFPPEHMGDPARVKAELSTLMEGGCGLVCIHYATGLRAEHVAEDGQHPLLRWLGGYFAAGCPHHRSVARVLTATIVPEKGDHPVLRGWQGFT